MQRLVAATPIEDPGAATAEPADTVEPRDGETLQDPAPPSQATVPGLSDDLPITAAVADTTQPPFFNLHYTRTELGPLPTLEVVCETPPVGRMQTGVPTADQRLSMLRAEWLGSVRGRFELLQGDTGWGLFWTPIDPPGDSTELISNLTQCAWEVLLRSEQGWQPVHAAYLQPDFPVAVRLQFATSDGAEADWLFETAIITEGR